VISSPALRLIWSTGRDEFLVVGPRTPPHTAVPVVNPWPINPRRRARLKVPDPASPVCARRQGLHALYVRSFLAAVFWTVNLTLGGSDRRDEVL
jgi:hypothetical protein